MRRSFAIKMAAVGGLALCTACGDTVMDQALLGGGAGAATSLLVDGDLATGIAVGAAANVVYCQKYPTRC